MMRALRRYYSRWFHIIVIASSTLLSLIIYFTFLQKLGFSTLIYNFFGLLCAAVGVAVATLSMRVFTMLTYTTTERVNLLKRSKHYHLIETIYDYTLGLAFLMVYFSIYASIILNSGIVGATARQVVSTVLFACYGCLAGMVYLCVWIFRNVKVICSLP